MMICARLLPRVRRVSSRSGLQRNTQRGVLYPSAAVDPHIHCVLLYLVAFAGSDANNFRVVIVVIEEVAAPDFFEVKNVKRAGHRLWKGAVQSKLRFKKAPELLYRFPLRIDILHENSDQMLARYSSREADRHPMG